jgi:hypothetical protein
MARTGLWAPAHRVIQRQPPGSGQQPWNLAPSLDAGGAGIQDGRLPWNTANSSAGAQALGWVAGNQHPLYDYVPATASTTNIAAAQAPTAGTPLTLVSSTGSGIVVSSSALRMLPSLVVVPSGTLFVDAVTTYSRFGNSDYTVFYDAGTLAARCLQVTSVGNDSSGTMSIVGYDMYGYLIHQTVTLTNASVVTTTKAFKAIVSATPLGTLSGSNISVGVADTVGLPMLGSTSPNSIWGFWNNLILAGAGTYTAGVTTTASATTGDVRGTYALGSASNGTKRLTLWQHPSVSQMIAQGMNNGIAGVPQF